MALEQITQTGSNRWRGAFGMDRAVFAGLREWKGRRDRMPLLLTGARQVGKTWLMREFGKRCFRNTAYVSFDSNPKLNRTLEATIYPAEFLPMLQSETNTVI